MSALTALELKELNSLLGDFFKKEYLNNVYPIGSLYLSVNSTNPSALFGGEWARIKDRFLLASGDKYTSGATGGESEVFLTKEQLPSHMHVVQTYSGTERIYINKDIIQGGTSSMISCHADENYLSAQIPSNENGRLIAKDTGSTLSEQRGQSHNNMPPYLSVYVWQRVA